MPYTGNWKPDFTAPDPYAGMPPEYAEQVKQTYVPTPSNPLPPLPPSYLRGYTPPVNISARPPIVQSMSRTPQGKPVTFIPYQPVIPNRSVSGNVSSSLPNVPKGIRTEFEQSDASKEFAKKIRDKGFTKENLLRAEGLAITSAGASGGAAIPIEGALLLAGLVVWGGVNAYANSDKIYNSVTAWYRDFVASHHREPTATEIPVKVNGTTTTLDKAIKMTPLPESMKGKVTETLPARTSIKTKQEQLPADAPAIHRQESIPIGQADTMPQESLPTSTKVKTRAEGFDLVRARAGDNVIMSVQTKTLDRADLSSIGASSAIGQQLLRQFEADQARKRLGIGESGHAVRESQARPTDYHLDEPGTQTERIAALREQLSPAQQKVLDQIRASGNEAILERESHRILTKEQIRLMKLEIIRQAMRVQVQSSMPEPVRYQLSKVEIGALISTAAMIKAAQLVSTQTKTLTKSQVKELVQQAVKEVTQNQTETKAQTALLTSTRIGEGTQNVEQTQEREHDRPIERTRENIRGDEITGKGTTYKPVLKHGRLQPMIDDERSASLPAGTVSWQQGQLGTGSQKRDVWITRYPDGKIVYSNKPPFNEQDRGRTPKQTIFYKGRPPVEFNTKVGFAQANVKMGKDISFNVKAPTLKIRQPSGERYLGGGVFKGHGRQHIGLY